MNNRKKFYKSTKKKKIINKFDLKNDIETVLKLNMKNYPSSGNMTSIDFTKNKNNIFFNNKEEDIIKSKAEEEFNTLAISIRKLKTYYPNIKDEVFNENYTNGQIPSRTEHINLEENIKSKIKKLSKKESELRKNQENLENFIKNLDKSMEDEELNIEAITNLDNNISQKQKNITEKIISEMLSKTPFRDKMKNKKIIDTNSKEFKEQLDLYLMREDYNTSQKIKDIKESIEKNKILKNEKLKELNDINENLKKVHENKKKEIEDLFMHYLNILKEGKDTRNEGLSWIIREIFNLDKKVIASFFPKFLDKLCIKYLFNITHINMKITELEKQIKICKADFKDKGLIKHIKKLDENDILTQRNIATKENLIKIKSQFSNNFKRSKDNKMSKNNVLEPLKAEENKKISTYLNNISNTEPNKLKRTHFKKNSDIKKDENNLPYIRGDPNNIMGGKDQGISYTNKLTKSEMKASIKIPPIIRIKDFNKMSFIKYHFTPNDIIKVNNFFSLRRKLSKLREEKDMLKTNEMDRIFKEFQRNNYAQKYNVDKIKVISALIGEDNINNELFRQERREKIYFDQITKSQLYTNNNKYSSTGFKDKTK